MDQPPPPPPPHGSKPKSSGLPDGKYDIFVIPPHMAGGGFLYLPSLKPSINSFAAGFASALILVAVASMIKPLFQVWWKGVSLAGNNTLLLIVAVAVGAWVLGRIQTNNGAGPGGGTPGGVPPQGGVPPPQAGPPPTGHQSNGYAHGGHGTGPMPGANMPGSGGMPHGGYAGAEQPKSGWQQRPTTPPGAHGAGGYSDPPNSDWQQKPHHSPGASTSSGYAAPEPPKSSWAKPDPPRPTAGASTASPKPEPPKPTYQKPTPPPNPPNPAGTSTGSAGPAKGAWEKAREETKRKEDERKAKEAERKRKEEIDKRLKDAREKESREREAREKVVRERELRERLQKDKERLEKEKLEKEKENGKQQEQLTKEKLLRERLEKLRIERERLAKERLEKEKLSDTKPKGSTYAFSAVGEKTNPWPHGQPPAPRSQPSSPTKRPPHPTAKTYLGTEEETYSYRPYDKPKQPLHKKAPSSAYSESSYAASQSTSRTTPPPSHRGPYSTKDPDKIVIKAVYSFNNTFMKTPTSQLVSGVGSVTDGLILRITTEGLFIDDDVRGVPQREWDVKAWTMKLVEVWCPSFRAGTSASARVASPAAKERTFRRLWGLDKDKPATSEETDSLLLSMLVLCKDNCRLSSSAASDYSASSASYDDRSSVSDSAYGSSVGSSSPSGDRKRTDKRGQTGEHKNARLHVLRASIRDQEGKKYVFVVSEEESWKLAVGLQRLRKGTQVRALGVSGMSASDAKGTLENLGWA